MNINFAALPGRHSLTKTMLANAIYQLKLIARAVRACKLIAYDAGRIVGIGNHAALQAVNGRYVDMWSMPQQASQWIVDEIWFYCSTCNNSLLLIT